MKVTLVEPTQASRAWTDVFPKIKDYLMAGNRLTLEIKDEKRSLEQNDMLWAMLTKISKEVDWYGQKLSPEDWKHVFTASLSKQRTVPGIDGGFVVLGLSTSKMTKKQMSDLIELIYAFASEKGVNLDQK